ncbi:three-finger toxin 3FTx-Oxy6-like [Anolis sagrei]|uniref:three-finger toxin 3FTx-Oxy6-like n=1 Tax=Anolis sagrei TaxID=38937 RepID=UPI003521E309
MNTILVTGYFILLYINIVGTLLCYHCSNVKTDNACQYKETTCNTKAINFCYTEIVSQGFSIKKVRRGCSSVCRSVSTKKRMFQKQMLCCIKDRCNDHTIWPRAK